MAAGKVDIYVHVTWESRTFGPSQLIKSSITSMATGKVFNYVHGNWESRKSRPTVSGKVVIYVHYTERNHAKSQFRARKTGFLDGNGDFA